MEAAVNAAGYTSWLLQIGLVLLWGLSAVRNITRYIAKASKPNTGAVQATVATIPALLFGVYLLMVPSLGLWAIDPNVAFSVPSHALTWPGVSFVGLTLLYFALGTAKHYLNTQRYEDLATNNPTRATTASKGTTA